MTLEKRCTAYLKERWEKLSPDAKRLLFDSEMRQFLQLMWERDYYRNLCLDLEERLRPCQHRDDGRGRCIDCGEFLPSSEGSAWKPSPCPADEQEREDQARREDAREHYDDEFASWRRG